jgi:hypothetical protein
MSRGCLAALSSLCALVILAPVLLAGQGSGWKVPRTPWGHPDLMGTYTNRTITPVQRPPELAYREFLTREEMIEAERERIERNRLLDETPSERTASGGVVERRAHERADGSTTGYYNNFWLDWGTKTTGRTSIIVDPEDGRIPPVTPEFARHQARRREQLLARGVPKKDWTVTGNGLADSWLDFQLNDRCIVWAAGPPMLPGPYNNTYMIFQNPDYVAIFVEMIHDVRIIPLDGRPHIPSSIRQYLGDMRGRWEGDTLVVETRNVRRTEGEAGAQGNDEIETRASNGRTDDTLRIVERFTRVDANTISYRFTIDDPSHWTRPFSGEFPFVKTDEKPYEFACHEGNYSVPNILSGARYEEREARESSR